MNEFISFQFGPNPVENPLCSFVFKELNHLFLCIKVREYINIEIQTPGFTHEEH